MNRILIYIGIALALSACKHDYTPKPRGYFRIDLPEKKYKSSPVGSVPFQFEYPEYAVLVKKTGTEDEQYWYDLAFPQQNAILYFSYKSINNNLDTYLNDARNFVYKHTIKADAISETPYVNPEKKAYGLLYEIKGDAASNLQFYMTDSSEHFFRGALYFNAVPNKDSLAPVIQFIEEDIVHLMETFEWK